MSEWEIVKLGEICDVRDGTHASPKETNTGRLLVTSKNLLGGLLSLDNAHYISSSDAAEIDKRSKVDQWDVLFSMIGTVGEVAIIREAPDFVIKNVGLFKTQGNESLANWIYYFFRSRNGRNEIRARLKGTSQQYISLGELRNFPIPCPPLATQRRITSVLSNYDSAIANCRRQIALLEEAAMRLYKEWFRDGKGENKTLGDLIVEIESGSRPRGGAVKSGIPSIGAEKIDGIGNYDYTGEKFVSREYFDRMKRGKIQDEDILLYKDGAYCGKVSMVLDGFPHKEAATNEHVFILRTDRHSAFLYCFLRQRKSFELLNKLACNKAAQPGLNQQDVLGVKIAIPPQDDMGSFENKVMPIMHTIAFLANQIRALTEARERLLPKLMNGEIAV